MIALIFEILALAYAIRCVTIGSKWEVQPVKILIDDRPYAPNPAQEGRKVVLIARKYGKNGNIKKAAAWETTGGVHTAALIEQLSRETATSRVEITIATTGDGCRPGDYCKSEEIFCSRIGGMLA